MPKLIHGESRQTQAAISNFPNLPDPAGIPISAAEVLLSTSAETIYRRIKDGTLQAFKMGGKRLISVGSIRKALAGGVSYER